MIKSLVRRTEDRLGSNHWLIITLLLIGEDSTLLHSLGTLAVESWDLVASLVKSVQFAGESSLTEESQDRKVLNLLTTFA